MPAGAARPEDPSHDRRARGGGGIVRVTGAHDDVAVIWHDVECGRYRADLPLWLELAEQEAGPVLDVGAGTGRVALELARAGHHVVALDREPAFLDALQERAVPGSLVQTVLGDAGDFDLDGLRFGLIIAPMQTIQLLGASGRAGFLRAAREHLTPDGLVACALAVDMEAWTCPPAVLPLPDMGYVDGVSYSSQPVALVDLGDRMAIERIRTILAPGAQPASVDDVIHLDKIDAAQVEVEAQAAGLWPRAARVIAPTQEHVGTTVAMFRG
jgi:SAM-dependent methyltransferase